VLNGKKAEKREIYLVCGNFPPSEKWEAHDRF
jgi:hypothetical protein